MNWNRILELKKKNYSPLEYCMKEAIETPSGAKIHILGVHHSSLASHQHVKEAAEAIAAVSKDKKVSVFAIESDNDRTDLRELKQMNFVRGIKGDFGQFVDSPKFQEGVDNSDPRLFASLQQMGFIETQDWDLGCFQVCVGALSGSPELTAMYQAETQESVLESIDTLSATKMMQNEQFADLSAKFTSKMSIVPESVLRMVAEEDDICWEFLRIVHGEKALREANVHTMHPRLAHNLAEIVERSPAWCDYLFAEMNRVLRPAQFWSRVFLRDLYMAWRLRDCAYELKKKETVLAVVGASHVEGVRTALKHFYKEDELSKQNKTRREFNYESLVSVLLLEDCTAFLEIWRNLGGLPYACAMPQSTKDVCQEILGGTFIPGLDVNVFMPDRRSEDEDSCPWHLMLLKSFDEESGEGVCAFEDGEEITLQLAGMWYRGEVDPYDKNSPEEYAFSSFVYFPFAGATFFSSARAEFAASISSNRRAPASPPAKL